jgi:ABC-type nitrate/sulfonate/bicarbonate transport system substrate-binding protein
VSPLRALRTLRLTLAVLLVSLASAGSAHAAEKLKVIVPDKESLQYLAFWVAKGGGSFEREGLDVELVVAPPPQRGKAPLEGFLESGEVDAAVLPPSAYLRMIAAKAPVVVVANLFRNDPYALVARPSVMSAHKVPEAGTPRERLAALEGATLAYPPAGYGRLKALLVSQQLDIDKNFKPTVLLSRDLATPFKDKSIELAYLLSPNLEKAIASGEGVLVVDQARNEVPELGNRQTNVLVVTRRVASERRDVVVAAVRAIADAERRVHAAQSEAVDALVREFPARERAELEAAVRLYEPGVPETPEVRAQDLAPALALIPESVPKPDLAGIDLTPFVASEVAAAAVAASDPGRRYRLIAIGFALAAAVISAALTVRRRIRAARG